MRNKDAATIASRARRKKTKPGLSVLAEYTCSCHPKIYVCKAGLGDCWLEHLADCGDEFITSDKAAKTLTAALTSKFSYEN